MTVLLVSVLALGFAGCGDDDEPESGSGGTPPAAQEETTSEESTSEESTSEESTSGANDAAAQAAQEGCEAGIKNNPAIEASKQEELSQECVKVGEAAASGDQEKFKEAYLSYCGKLAEALPEAGRDAAKDACEQGAAALGG